MAEHTPVAMHYLCRGCCLACWNSKVPTKCSSWLECYSHMQRVQDAINNYEIGIEMFRAGIGENTKQCAEAYSRLGAAYYLLGNSSQQAIELLEHGAAQLVEHAEDCLNSLEKWEDEQEKF